MTSVAAAADDVSSDGSSLPSSVHSSPATSDYFSDVSSDDLNIVNVAGDETDDASSGFSWQSEIPPISDFSSFSDTPNASHSSVAAEPPEDEPRFPMWVLIAVIFGVGFAMWVFW